jgi:hypothetical protein
MRYVCSYLVTSDSLRAWKFEKKSFNSSENNENVLSQNFESFQGDVPGIDVMITNFSYFLPIFGEQNWRFFLKTNICIIQLLLN